MHSFIALTWNAQGKCLINAETGHVGFSTKMSRLPDYQEWACRCWSWLLVVRWFINS